MLQTSITKWLTKPKAVTQSSANSDAVPLQSQQANKRNNSTITNDISAPTLSPPPIPPPQPSNIVQNNGTISITAANLSTTPALTTLPALSPNITLAPLTAPTLASFRRLNTLLLEIPYPAKFYDEILTDPTTASITLAAFWHNTNAPDPGPKNPGILVAGIRCRLLSAACSPDLPPPAPTQQTTAPQPHLYIATLSTLSPYRHHGLATHLLAAVTRAAIERHKVGAVYAHVWVANEDGLAWYRRRGFAVLRRVEGYYRRLRPSGAWVVWRRVGVGDMLAVGGADERMGGVEEGGEEERMEGVVEEEEEDEMMGEGGRDGVADVEMGGMDERG